MAAPTEETTAGLGTEGLGTEGLGTEGLGDAELFDRLSGASARLREAIGSRIVGQTDLIDQLLAALFSGGHCLLVGVPGLAKTLLVSTTAHALGLRFGRVQFTPDLMPADIIGTEVLDRDRETGERVFRFIRGPVFTHMLLADEINRTPPKTQAALLQAMAEREVTAGGRTWPLEAPFQVFATQNPIEQEGTYPLPEAELDRFMFSLNVDYPSQAEEEEIVERTTGERLSPPAAVLSRAELLAFQGLVRRLPSSTELHRYAVRLARATRPGPDSSDLIRRSLRWGAGPRASQYLIIGARTRAALRGHEVADPDDVRAIAEAVLAHRLVLGFRAEAEGVTRSDIVRHVVETVPRRS